MTFPLAPSENCVLPCWTMKWCRGVGVLNKSSSSSSLFIHKVVSLHQIIFLGDYTKHRWNNTNKFYLGRSHLANSNVQLWNYIHTFFIWSTKKGPAKDLKRLSLKGAPFLPCSLQKGGKLNTLVISLVANPDCEPKG